MFFACENPYVRELLRAPVHLESVRVTTDLWQNGQPPCALSPEFSPNVTKYEITVPYDTKEVYFRGSPRFRASVRYAAADGSPALREGVFSYDGIYEPRVFTVTAWEQYMDDTVYVFTVKRELHTSELQDLRVWYDLSTNNSDIVDNKNYLTETFAKNYTGYHANINAEANAVIALVLPAADGAQTFAYTDESGTYDPAGSGWIGAETIDSTNYQRIRIPFLKTQHNTGTLSVTTAQPGMSPTTYTLQLIREKTVVKLATLTVTPQGPAGTAWALDGDPLAGGFDPGSQNYGGEFTKETTGVKIEAELDSFAPPGSMITYDISPSTIAFSTFENDSKTIMSFTSPLNKFVVSINITSGNTATHDHNLYTVTVTREGVFQIVKDPDVDAELKVRIQNAGGYEVGSVQLGTPLTLTVTNNLGYTISGVTVDLNGGAGPDSNIINGTLPGGVIVTNTLTEFKYTFTMPAKNLVFRAAHASIASVDKVAYVAQEGRNSAGYDSAAHTADSWGTASTDLQKVINSWNGSNFDEIWIMGTVAPKSRANINIAGYSASIPISAVPDNNPTVTEKKNLAFVIPPGLRLYGGFRGTETASGTIKSGAADTRDKTINDSEDWRQRTVLSGSLDSLNKAYHVIIMADIPDDQATVLDGFTVTGGQGAASSGTISVNSKSIDRQSGAGMYLVNASPVIRNLRIQENTAQKNGGGMLNQASGGTSSPRIEDTVFFHNTVMGDGQGAGIYLAASNSSTSSPELVRVTIDQNLTGGRGGGIFTSALTSSSVCAPVITDSAITGNAASDGGGVYNKAGSPRFTGVLIQGNSAGTDGGGVYSSSSSDNGFNNSSPVFEQVTIAGNRAKFGGGVANYSRYLAMTNTSISGNYAADHGGGIYNYHGGTVLTNVRLERNNAKRLGGAIHNVAEQAGANINNRYTTLVITNGIIRGNKAASGSGISADFTFQSANQVQQFNYLALTNVLIAENIATTDGGGMYISNTTNNAQWPGKGIKILMNNVTIARNQGNLGTGTGGMYIYGGANNKVDIKANNCVIWGNTSSLAGTSAHWNIHYSAGGTGQLTMASSLVESGDYTNGGNNKDPLKFDGPNGPFAGASEYTIIDGTDAGTNAGARLKNGGDDSLYPGDANVLLDNSGGTNNNGAFEGDGGRYTIFWGLIDDAVFNSGAIKPHLKNNNQKDASAAQGDLRYKVTGHGEDYSAVVVESETKTASTNQRIKNGVIDVGAYENQ